MGFVCIVCLLEWMGKVHHTAPQQRTDAAGAEDEGGARAEGGLQGEVRGGAAGMERDAEVEAAAEAAVV